MNTWRRDLRLLMKDAVQFDVPLASKVTFRTGGEADAMVPVHCQEQLQELGRFSHQRDLPLTVLGGGSNVLISDRGIRGITVCLTDKGAAPRVLDQTPSGRLTKLTTWSGTRNAALVKHSLIFGLTGLEFLCGIPGTIGGAVATNAGAHGSCIEQLVESVTVMNPAGELEQRSKADCNFGYRTSGLRAREIITSITLGLEQGKPKDSKRLICSQHTLRLATQPIRFPNAGSVFLNPSDDYAARLIEASGFKGARLGGALVSKVHANFIVNRGRASSTEIRRLGEAIRNRVLALHGIDLNWEIKPIGEWTG